MATRKRKGDNSDIASILPLNKRITRKNMKPCRICSLPISLEYNGDEGVSVMCKICNEKFHAKCLGMSVDFVFKIIQSSKKGWTCHGCFQETFKFMENLDQRLKAIEEKVEGNSEKIKIVNVRTEQSLIQLNDHIVNLESQLNNQIEEIRQLVRTNPPNPSNSVSDSSSAADIRYIRDLQRKNNLVISNVPIQNSESQDSLKLLVTKIAAALGCEMDTQQINVVIRLNKKGDKTASAMLVKFTDEIIKQEVFSAYIATVTRKNPITFRSVGFQSDQRVYINHHISPELAEIKKKALELKKINVIGKVNARYNNIRVQIGGNWHNVTSMDQLKALLEEDTEEMRP